MIHGFDRFFPRTPENEKRIAPVKEWALAHKGESITALSYSTYRIFSETGSRVEYEALYMKRRERLWHYFLMSMWDDDPQWIDELSDAIFAICEENTWMFPAHIPNDADYTYLRTGIDLFAAETSQALSECYYLLGDRLPRLIRDAITYNVKERIVKPYIEKNIEFHRNNWSAVCNGCVAMSMIELGLNKEFDTCEDKFINGLNVFLESYPDDGICLEGPLYWSYGFGFFAYAAAMIREHTGGRVDLFASEKVKKCAAFYEYAFVNAPYTVPFADAGHILYLNPGLIAFLAQEYKTSMINKNAATIYGCDLRYRTADAIRNFFWGGKYAESDTVNTMRYFESSQWYISKKERYVLAAKGGCNSEPHNHNDIGSFVVYDGKNYVADDLGWCEYDANYFNNDRRYADYIVASSLGHSVPIIDGGAQLFGEERRAVVLCANEKEFSLDLSKAYNQPIGTVVRKFTTEENGVCVTDVTSGVTLVSRIALRIKPTVIDNRVIVGDAVIETDGECDIRVSSEEFETRYSVAISDTGRYVTAYFVDFIPENKSTVSLKFKIKEGNNN